MSIFDVWTISIILVHSPTSSYYEQIEFTTCCSCNIFPKFKKIWDPPLIHFAELFGFAWCLHKDYFDASNVLMFELILPCHREYFGFLSRESSHLRARRCGKERDIKSESSVFGLRCIFYIDVCFEIPSEPLSIRLPPLRRRYRKFFRELFYLLPIPTIFYS